MIKKSLYFAAILALSAAPAFAVSNIRDPYVNKGEFELEYKANWTHDDDDKDQKNKQKHVVEVGYGFSDYWAAKIEGALERESGESLDLEEMEFELKHQFTDLGEYWWDVGVQAAYGWHVEEHAADTVEALLLLQNNLDDFITRANIELKHDFGVDNHDIEVEARAVVLYDYRPYLMPGIEWQGEFGAVDAIPGYDEQEHFIGPALYGEVYLSDDHQSGEIEYELGYLFGVSDAAADGAVRFLLAYERAF